MIALMIVQAWHPVIVVAFALGAMILILGCAKNNKKKIIHRCEWCGKEFTLAEQLQRHTEAEHTVRSPSSNGKGASKDYVTVKRTSLVPERDNPFGGGQNINDGNLNGSAPDSLPERPPAVVPYHQTPANKNNTDGRVNRIEVVPTYEEPVDMNFPEQKLSELDDILGKLAVQRDKIEIGKKLGEGVAGIVYRGTFGGKEVAVKELISTESEARDEFMQEAVIMGSLKNPRVVRILGVCMEPGLPLQIVTELMENGDLRAYLRHKRDEGLTVQKVGYEFLTQVSVDVCEGLEFLDSIGCVHRDVAARNVLLDNNLRGKLNDFGLSRDLYRKVYYEMKNARQLPVRWLAFETLTMGKASSKSDVWAFGVLMWETMTLCKLPYENLPGGREIVTFLDSGLRLSQPSACPEALYALMLACWSSNPENRPSAAELLPRVDAIAASARAGTLIQTVQNGDSSLPPTPTVAKNMSTPVSSAGTQKYMPMSSPGTEAFMLPESANSTAQPRSKRAWWKLGVVNRKQAEETMRAWGVLPGLFLIRESSDKGWVLSRCVRMSSDAEIKFSHSKIALEGTNYRLVTKNPAFSETVFSSLETLVAHFQQQPFPDGSHLVTVPPPLAVMDYIEVVDEEASPNKYVNVANRRSGDKSGYVNMRDEDHIFRHGSGAGFSEGQTPANHQYINQSTFAEAIPATRSNNM